MKNESDSELKDAPYIEGYCTPLSGAPRDHLQFKISTTAPWYEVTFLKLCWQADGNIGVEMTSDVPRRHNSISQQPNAPGRPAWQWGCENWSTDFVLCIPPEWESGLYAACLKNSEGAHYFIVFVVRPTHSEPVSTLPTQISYKPKLLVLANTNTWNAYNDWGGASRYKVPLGNDSGMGRYQFSFERPNPKATPQWPTEPTNPTHPVDEDSRHLARAELLVLSWLLRNHHSEFNFDVCSDHDFHVGNVNLGGYKAIMLNTHPEYWTTEMRNRLDEYILNGGNVLYLGGNGLFERVKYTKDMSAMVVCQGIGRVGEDRARYRARPQRFTQERRPASHTLGVTSDNNDTTTYAPYKLENIQGPNIDLTALALPDLIGSTGVFGPASGWEMDTIQGAEDQCGIPGPHPDSHCIAPPPYVRKFETGVLQLLAKGTNEINGVKTGAEMVFFRPQKTPFASPCGGFVFSVGSISFGGSLYVDENLQKLVSYILGQL